MRIGSLCSGVGGLELGLERAGWGETVWHAEIDPHASQILARHWDVPNLGDFRTTDWTQVEPVDVVCAGYPCQPFSQAGQRKGTEDDRHLWPAVRDAIRDLGPRLVVLENVRGHLSLGFDHVLGDLADLGFDAEWCLLRASDIGAPHQRARLFVAAYPTRPEWGTTELQTVGTAVEPAAELGERDSADVSAADPPRVRHDRTGEARQRRPQPTDSGLSAPAIWGQYAAAVNRWEELTRIAPHPTDDGRLSPEFVEWMMGFPDGWVDGLPRSAALRVLGNAVHPWVSELFARTIPMAVAA